MWKDYWQERKKKSRSQEVEFKKQNNNKKTMPEGFFTTAQTGSMVGKNFTVQYRNSQRKIKLFSETAAIIILTW